MVDTQLENWWENFLVCPRDQTKITTLDEHTLSCSLHHTYPIIAGIPVMLPVGVESTQKDIYNHSLAIARSYESLHSIKQTQQIDKGNHGVINQFVQKAIGATCGRMYTPLINRLSEYPIPDLFLLDQGEGKLFLDIGCNWGRWCISASRRGFQSFGIDHNLEALIAARSVAQQLGCQVYYVAADARHLPFVPDTFDVAFSYSVLQHFSKHDVKMCLVDIARVLKQESVCLIQMANMFGMHNLYHQLKRGFRNPADFEIRYWRPRELFHTFTALIGSGSLYVDGFFSLNSQIARKNILPCPYRLITFFSEILRKASRHIPLLKYFADSLYVKVRKRHTG